jgi:hypothetical protein
LSDVLWQLADEVGQITIEKHKKMPAVEYTIKGKRYLILRETFKTPKEAVDFIFSQPHDVKIIEGYTLSLNKKQSFRLPKEDTSVIYLNTPVAECIQSIQSRRDGNGIVEPVKPDKVTADYEKIAEIVKLLEDEKYKVFRESRDSALPILLALLGISAI